MNKIILSVMAPVLCGFFALTSCAAEAQGPQADEARSWKLHQSTSYAFERDARSQSGGLSVGITSFKLDKEYKFDNGMPLDLGIDIDHYMIHDTTAADLPPSLQSKGVTAGIKIPMPFTENEQWYMGLSTGAYFQTAGNHAFPSSSFRSKNRVYGIYKPSDALILVAGVGYNPDYEDNTVLPFLGIKYRFNERWTLRALSTQPSLAYQMNDKTELRLEGSIHTDEFEVNDGVRKGDIVKVSDYRVGLGASYQFNEDWKLSSGAGLALGGQYEYLQNGGKVALDRGFYLSYALTWKF
ncbi:MAG TPA: DUF6268 family outer membrane beta-barrel protein [Candidatus Omnitrophota bacterium]|nr:DUF6268 family outer membrane beta-barrel protein [Candidatus Omnitrophota bacterium]